MSLLLSKNKCKCIFSKIIGFILQFDYTITNTGNAELIDWQKSLCISTKIGWT